MSGLAFLHLRRVIPAVACLFVSLIAHSQELTSAELLKAPPEVVARAKRGESQDLFVTLDAKEVQERADAVMRSRGLKHYDQAVAEQVWSGFDEVKNAVFPNGRLGDAQVLRSDRGVPVLLVRVPDYAALVKVLTHPRVKRVNENKEYRLALAESLPMIGQPAALSQGKRGSGFRVAVIDSGATLANSAWATNGAGGCRWNTTDPGYSGPSSWPYIGSGSCRITNALDFTAADPWKTPAMWNFYDRDPGLPGHGTNVAAIVAGVAPDVKLDVLNVMKSGSYPNTDFIAITKALQWVISNANKSPPIVAVNLSVATDTKYTDECPSSGYAEYFKQLRRAGVLPVVATGNSGFSDGVGEPACVPGAIRVGGVYDADRSVPSNWSSCSDGAPKKDQVFCASNSGKLVDLLAPGAYITAPADLGGLAGTSQAAPHVAGAVAVLKQAFPSDTADNILLRMTASGKSIRDPKNGITKPRLDIAAALATGAITGTAPSDPMVVAKFVSSVLIPLIL